jgi:uncharacterized membrane protein YqaE (UPF0057 family)
MTSPTETTHRTPTSPETERNRDILRVLLSIILPPLGVFLQEGLGKHFWINVLLTILGYIPGIIHAVWVIMRR